MGVEDSTYWRNEAWVLKKEQSEEIFSRSVCCTCASSRRVVSLSRRRRPRWWRLTQEADQSPNVLRSCRQEELLTYEF